MHSIVIEMQSGALCIYLSIFFNEKSLACTLIMELRKASK